MKKLLILGGSRYAVPVIETAHRLGIYVITADYLPDNIAHKYSDEYVNVSIIEKEKVLAVAKELKIVATSFILGLIFGGIYDIIRYTTILCGFLPRRGESRRPGAAVFLADLLTVLGMGAAFSVYVYWANEGIFRWYMGAGAAAA